MPVPQFLQDLLALLYAIATPAALLTLVAAGMSLRTEGGINFHMNGRTGKWIIWTMILLTLPQILQWIGTAGFDIPVNPGGVAEGWINTDLTAFKNFVSLVISTFVPTVAGFLVLKATLDTAAGENPLASIVSAIFLLSIPATQSLFQGMNSGSSTATFDMLNQFLGYLAGRVLPPAAGLAVVGAVVNFTQRKPFMRLVFSAIGFLSVSGLIALIKAIAA